MSVLFTSDLHFDHENAITFDNRPFANIKETTFENTKKKIYQVLLDIYEQNTFLLKEHTLEETEEAFFRSVNMNMHETTATQAIHEMCKYLYQSYRSFLYYFLS